MCAGVDRARPRDNGAPTAAITRADDEAWSVESRAPARDWAPDEATSRASPWLPTAGVDACPERWTSGDDRTCAAPVPARCEAHRFASVSRCVPAMECSSVEDVVIPSGAQARYVSASASEEGDGSLARPSATFARALEDLPANAWVVLGPCVDRGTMRVRHSLTIVGACAEGVMIEGDAASPTLSVGEGATINLEESVVRDGVGYGVFATGAGTHIQVTRSAFRATRARRDGLRGRSAHVEQ